MISRIALHYFVWHEPLSTLAPRLGISNVGLKKLCARHGIPTPPVGYWWKRTRQNDWCGFQLRPSTCTEFHDEIMRGIDAGLSNKEILESLHAQGYKGERSSLQRFISKLMAGKIRTTKRANGYRQFLRIVRVPGKARFRKPVPLPDGPNVLIEIREHPGRVPAYVAMTARLNARVRQMA